MECLGIINLLYNTTNQPSKFNRKNWFEINYNTWGKYNKDSQIRFKTSMWRSSLCDNKIRFTWWIYTW